MGKGENVGYQYFLFSLQSFHNVFKLHWLKASKLLSWRCVVCSSINFALKKLLLRNYIIILTGFLPNFTGMFLWWSSFKFLQTIVFHGNQSKKHLKIFSSQATNWIALIFCRNVHLVEMYRIP